jgi:hypothetical protein
VTPSACNSGAEEAGIGEDAFAERDMGALQRKLRIKKV